MKGSPKLSPTAKKRLVAVIVLSLLAVAAMAVVFPQAILGPVGGNLAAY